MDHLPLPHSPTYPPFEVPFLGFGYLGGPFLDYDVREGISHTDLFTRTSLSKPGDHVSAFLQSWLFFGLMMSVFDVEFPTDNFVHSPPDSNRPLLTTAYLPSLTLHWIQRVRALGGTDDALSEKADWHAHTLACLEKTHSVLVRLQVYAPKLLPEEVFVSLLALGEYLATATVVAFEGWKSPALHWAPTLAADDILSKRLRAQGCCSSQIGLIWGKGSVAALYFASNLNIKLDKEHERCNMRKCEARQINEQSYFTRHAEEGCRGGTCQHMQSDQGEMLSILRRDDSIPLILYTRSETNQSNIQIVDSRDVDFYVAISHVWSDGMGNNKNNSIWECQLHYLSRAVESLYPEAKGPVPFWFDTICFPLQPDEGYQLAMQKMKATYEDADKVLVVDASLRCVDESLLTNAECMVRIGFTGWMRRLWTLQEGILAKNLQFQFANRAFDIDRAYEEYFQEDWTTEMMPKWAESNALSICVATLVQEIRMITPEDPVNWISTVARGLAFRSTSVSTDEAICLAVLLSLDMRSILSVPGEKRMQQAWKLMGEAGIVHPNALFTGSAKLETDGFKWAPKSLLDAQNSELYAENVPGDLPELLTEGLLVKRIGFVLKPSLPIDRSFFFCDEQGDWYKVTVQGQGVENSLPASKASARHWRLRRHAPSVGIIRQDSKPLSSLPIPSTPAILVNINEMEEDVIYAEIVSKIWIVRADERQSTGFALADRCKRGDPDAVLAHVSQDPHDVIRGQLAWDMDQWRGVVGRQTSGSQKWIIK